MHLGGKGTKKFSFVQVFAPFSLFFILFFTLFLQIAYFCHAKTMPKRIDETQQKGLPNGSPFCNIF
jgi:ATP/ADP translocase